MGGHQVVQPAGDRSEIAFRKVRDSACAPK
jgi:hypothetical protein